MQRSIRQGAISALCVAASLLAPSAGAQVASYTWVDGNDERGGRNLVRMVPESDDIVVVMECRRARRAVHITLYALDDRVRSVALSSGPVRATLSGQTLNDEMTGLRFEGELSRRSPFWARFQSSGQFVARAGARTFNEPADPEDRRSIARFLRDCPA